MIDFKRGKYKMSISLCTSACEICCKGNHLQTKKRALSKHHLCQHLDLRVPRLQNYEKCLLLKPLVDGNLL